MNDDEGNEGGSGRGLVSKEKMELEVRIMMCIEGEEATDDKDKNRGKRGK